MSVYQHDCNYCVHKPESYIDLRDGEMGCPSCGASVEFDFLRVRLKGMGPKNTHQLLMIAPSKMTCKECEFSMNKIFVKCGKTIIGGNLFEGVAFDIRIGEDVVYADGEEDAE